MNKLLYAIVLALAIVLFIPANALAQPNATDPRFERYQPIIVDTACFLYGQGCDEFETDPSGLHFYDTQTGKIFKYKPVNDVPLCHDPYYVAGRLGSTCHDEGDDPTLTPTPEPAVCTPNGPPCPPCPEGVEAGWCADEDERQDTGDDLGNDDVPCKHVEGSGGCNGGDDEPEGGDGSGSGGDGEEGGDIPRIFDGENEGNNGEDDGDQEVGVSELIG